MSDILGEVVPDMRTETGERAKAKSSAVEASEFEYACLMKSGEWEGLYSCIRSER